MRTLSIAAIPADGIGPEVISSGIRVLEALAKRAGDLSFNVRTFDWGSDYYKKHGVMMPADGLEQLKKFDAIYFGTSAGLYTLGVWAPQSSSSDCRR